MMKPDKSFGVTAFLPSCVFFPESWIHNVGGQDHDSTACRIVKACLSISEIAMITSRVDYSQITVANKLRKKTSRVTCDMVRTFPRHKSATVCHGATWQKVLRILFNVDVIAASTQVFTVNIYMIMIGYHHVPVV